MAAPKKTVWYVVAASVVTATAGGLTICDRIGWAMPWSAAHAAEMRAADEELRIEIRSAREIVIDNSAKLDMLLQAQGLYYKDKGKDE